MLVTIHRPAYCQGRRPMIPGSGEFYGGHHRVHWRSLLHSHVTMIDGLVGDMNFQVC